MLHSSEPKLFSQTKLSLTRIILELVNLFTTSGGTLPVLGLNLSWLCGLTKTWGGPGPCNGPEKNFYSCSPVLFCVIWACAAIWPCYCKVTEEVQSETQPATACNRSRVQTTGGFLIWVCRGWRKAGKINLHCAVLFWVFLLSSTTDQVNWNKYMDHVFRKKYCRLSTWQHQSKSSDTNKGDSMTLLALHWHGGISTTQMLQWNFSPILIDF